MWNGKGVPAAAGQAIPLSCRIMHVAATAVLFAAHAGAEAAVIRGTPARGQLSRPRPRRRLRGPGRRTPGGPRPRRRVRVGARVGTRPGAARRRRGVRGVGADVRAPRRPQEPQPARALRGRGRPCRGRRAEARSARAGPDRAHRRVPARSRPGRRLQPHLGQAGATERRRARPGPAASVLQRAGPRPGPPAGRGGEAGRTASRALRRQRLPPRSDGRAAVHVLARARGRRRLPDPGRRPPAPARAVHGAGGRTAAGRGQGRSPRRGGPRGCAAGSRRRRRNAARPPVRPDAAAGRGAPAAGERHVQPGYRATPGDLAPYGRAPRPGHLPEDRRHLPGGRRALRDGARAARQTWVGQPMSRRRPRPTLAA